MFRKRSINLSDLLTEDTNPQDVGLDSPSSLVRPSVCRTTHTKLDDDLN